MHGNWYKRWPKDLIVSQYSKKHQQQVKRKVEAMEQKVQKFNQINSRQFKYSQCGQDARVVVTHQGEIKLCFIKNYTFIP